MSDIDHTVQCTLYVRRSIISDKEEVESFITAAVTVHDLLSYTT